MPPKPEKPTEPGADRFWGQFSQSRAGRTDSGEGGSTSRNETGNRDAGGEGHCLEWCPICRSAELFKATVSPELRQQAESIQHEALGVFKAFLDAYAEKTTANGAADAAAPGDGDGDGDGDGPAPQPQSRVTDIPLD